MTMWWWCTTICIHVKAENDSLKLGDTLNSTSMLVSKEGKYCMNFTQNPDPKSLTYLQIRVQRKDVWAVWFANRNQPVEMGSAVLALNNSGVLKIESNIGKPIILYSSPQPFNKSTIVVATLLDTGNFVLQQIQPNGMKIVLWQSFDHPTDSLLPEMKLGVNHKTGHNWSLVSWLGHSNPTDGPFKLDWEPRRRELVIKHRDKVYWTSGEFKNNRFEHISADGFQYKILSNENEEYFTYTTPNEDDLTKWTLLETGQLINRKGDDIARADLCYGYNTDGGCQKYEKVPTCRNSGDVFESKQGYPNHIMLNNLGNANYSISDCQTICWKNCSCIGFKTFYDNGTGCMFFLSMEGINIASGGDQFYILVKNTHHKKGMHPTTTITQLLVLDPLLCIIHDNM